MRIVWDEPKRLTNLATRGMDFASLDLAFLEAVVIPSRNQRFKAISWFEDGPLTVIFRPLGTEAISVISMRRASRKERFLL